MYRIQANVYTVAPIQIKLALIIEAHLNMNNGLCTSIKCRQDVFILSIAVAQPRVVLLNAESYVQSDSLRPNLLADTRTCNENSNKIFYPVRAANYDDTKSFLVPCRIASITVHQVATYTLYNSIF